MRVIAIKNKFVNQRGGKKIKVLTSGKVYNVTKKMDFGAGYFLLNDVDEFYFYPKDYFQSIQKNRDNILKTLFNGF